SVAGGGPALVPARGPPSGRGRSLLCLPIPVLPPGAAPVADGPSRHSAGACGAGCLPSAGVGRGPLLVLPARPDLPGQPSNPAGQAGKSELSRGRTGRAVWPECALAALPRVRCGPRGRGAPRGRHRVFGGGRFLGRRPPAPDAKLPGGESSRSVLAGL